MSSSKLLLVGLVVCLPQYSFSSEGFARVEDAKNQIIEYRALRKACAITQGDQRKVCFSQLNESTGRYQKAKEFLARQTPAMENLIGQAPVTQ